ncbi:AraC family transcriptional regulator [Bacteroides sp. 214]|uniref:helix-turn-helix domain-containing protein n=1 Tax=Bacteroides sp. 214 TaxID=2302935 RepID=UPI0013D6D17A|nr:helix-turn-helix domain-containing protein [Bacteroides sp. 214]NDW12916.1 AraC family transcriptional regulator [Bacteroides sp. 214]
MKYIYFTLVLLLFSYYATANSMDSLYRLLPTLEGEAKLEVYDQMYLMTDYSMDPEKVLKLLNDFLHEAEKQGMLNYETTMYAAILNFYYNHGWKEEFMEAFPEHIRFLEENDEELMLLMWSLKIRLYLFDRQYSQALEEAEALRTEIAQKKDPYLLGVVIGEIGMIYKEQGHIQQAIPLLIEAIELMKQKPSYDPGSMFNGYYHLANALLGEHRLEEAIHYNAEYEALIRKEEEEALERYGTVDDNIRIILNKYFCYSLYAKVYLEKEELDKTAHYLNECEAMLPKVGEDTEDFFYAKALYLDKKGAYYQAAEQIQRIIDRLEDGTIKATEIAQPKWYKLKADYLTKAGHNKEAGELYNTAYSQLEESNHWEFESRIADLRTRYEVDKLEAEKLRNRNYFLFALGGCVLLALILFLIINYQRRLRAKNRRLIRQIESQDVLKTELRNIRQQRLSDSVTKNTNLPEETAEAILFARLENYLRTTHIYINPELDRQQLINTLATNQTYLYNAVKVVTGMSLQEYINSLRLEKAKEMLKNSPNESIAQISAQCGFTTIQTFRRQFKECYGLTASEYRNSLG